jgi:tRNA threonylcarbamoyladenosine biosynthesis protein TsaB
MLLLAADTSGKHGSIALARGNADGSCDVLEVVSLAGGNFSAQLIPQVAALLSKHGFHKQDLAGFAAVSGPGSFTGLRVGLAAIKALGEATGKPIATVSLLELVALAGGGSGRVLAALEAGRGEVYVGRYDVAGDRASMVSEKLITRTALAEAAPDERVVTPDMSVAEALKALGVKTVTIEPPASDAVARLGWKKILARDTVSPEALEANYIRRTDAEIFSKSAS